jgi:hypothetical protein
LLTRLDARADGAVLGEFLTLGSWFFELSVVEGLLVLRVDEGVLTIFASEYFVRHKDILPQRNPAFRRGSTIL